MVIITAVTAILVLVSGNYAYQVLERQQGASEFDAVRKSFLAFEDRDMSVTMALRISMRIPRAVGK